MLNIKEIKIIILTTIILAFAISLLETWNIFLYSLLSIFIILILNISAKKITSFYLDSKIEINIWNFQRYGFKPSRKLKRSFPMGAFLPIVSKIFLFPLQNFVWMASLVFEIKPKIYRSAKRHGFYSFSEMTENHIGIIAATGIFINLLAATISYIIGYEEFAKLNLYFVFFNMFPISDLDGNKIFFGNRILWIFLAIVTLLFLASSFLLV